MLCTLCLKTTVVDTVYPHDLTTTLCSFLLENGLKIRSVSIYLNLRCCCKANKCVMNILFTGRKICHHATAAEKFPSTIKYPTSHDRRLDSLM